MPITPQSLIPSPVPAQVSTATVINMGQSAAAVTLPGGQTVVASVPMGAAYAAGQRVMVSIPGGQLAMAQVTGLATGNARAVRQVHVPFE